ncbi:unnamed protein product (macronuclear) [Paramecium tetraurelia]|uniref:VWFA domain-containing protein n=1 Tax=Paramecium tetraurelia TaxID=5888 RepID=A0CET3_PARTE|nr:uncharacterized protein GSPATT00037739001 [Paramecium tetraurelia]CAK69300.1 unnamed protein product [Paramecium tetraurelia]|eukprot:XP_001436697.1 hypothetical protein (macronuclear) [Paramecium tetraurelia strain d4-2]
MKESKPIIDQKLGATRSKKVKKNESDEDSDYVNTSTKQKKSNQSSKIKTSTTKQKESIHSDDSQDKLSPELKPSSRQKTRTKAEKMHDKHKYDQVNCYSTKTDEVKDKQENQNTNQDKEDENREKPQKSDQIRNNIEEENKQNDLDQKRVNGKDQESNQENLNKNNSKDKDLSNENQPNNLIQQQENEHKDDKNKNELSDKEKNKEKQLNQTDNNEEQKNKDPQENIKNNQPQNQSDQKVALQIIVTAPESETKKNQKEEEEEKEQQEKQQKATVDIVFCCDANLLNSNSVDQIKNTIEFILEQIKEREKCSSNIKFSIVSFNDIITNQKLQQCQVIDLCDEEEILQNLDEIKQMVQVEVQKGVYYGLKVATQTTKWRRETNNKSFRYIIHIANKQLQLDNQSEELEGIIQEMNNKNIRYKYLRIDQKIDLDFDGKQYLQNKLNSYEESFLKEFGSLKNVVSGIILRELTHENNK